MKVTVARLHLCLLASVLILSGCASSNSSSSSSPFGKGSPELAATYNTELGINYMQEGHMDLAQQKLDLALKQAPNQPMVHNALALYYEHLGEDQQANREYRRSLSLKPDNPDTLNNYGTFLCRTGHPKKSLKFFVKAANNLSYDTPDSAFANAGTCALKIPNRKLAKHYFKQALAVNPQMNQALWELGLMAFKQGEFRKANPYLARLLANDSSPSARMLWIAVETEWALGNRQKAQQYGRQLLKQYPKSPEAKKFVRLIRND